MRRVVGAVVVIGMICLGTLRGEWMIRVRPLAPDSLTLTLSDPSPTPATGPAPAARHHTAPPPAFASDPLAFLSRAPADSLDLLPGIGPVLAARILQARVARGAFASWDDVMAVKGIGPRLVARWRALAARQ